MQIVNDMVGRQTGVREGVSRGEGFGKTSSWMDILIIDRSQNGARKGLDRYAAEIALRDYGR